MPLVLVLVLSLSAVNCIFISENFIIEKQDINVAKTYNTPFKVYWNVPTKQCRSKNIPFDDLLRKFKITYNKNDRFEGETITTFYDVGLTPTILKRDGVKYSVKNGGLPQEGNLDIHLAAFREAVVRLIPNPDFDGVGVIDMENWRPIFRQHWGSFEPIIDLSLSITKRQYWWWPASWQKMEASKRFEDAARIFMEKTLSAAKQMRPKAVWGYYGYPYCFNMNGNNKEEHCSKDVKAENDRTYWLWAESTALYPSIYSSNVSTFHLEKLVRGRLTEANRVKKPGDLVLPYFALTYRDGSFFKERDIVAVFESLQKKDASGLIVWESSKLVNTVQKCEELYNYINSSFGPIVKKYIQRINNIRDNKREESKNIDDSNSTLNKSSKTIPPITLNTSNDNILNITTKPENIAHESQINKYFYETDENNINESDIFWSISEDVSVKILNNKSDNLSPLFKIMNITERNNTSNNLIKPIQGNTTYLTNPVNVTSNINITETNDPHLIKPIKQKEQLNKYNYKGDENTVQNSNESFIESIKKYEITSADENTTKRISQQHIEHLETLSSTYTVNTINIQNTIKIPSTTGNTIFTESTENNNILSETEKIQLGNTINPSIETTNFTEKTHPINTSLIMSATENALETTTSYLPLQQEQQLNKFYYETENNKVELKSLNESETWSIIEYETSSEIDNFTEKVKNITEPANKIFEGTPNFIKESHLINHIYYSIQSNTLENTTSPISTSMDRQGHNNSDKIDYGKPIDVPQDLPLLPLYNNHLKIISQNLKKQEQPLEITTNLKFAVTDSRENVNSDLLITIKEVNFTSLMNDYNTDVRNKYSKDFSQNVKQNQQHIKNSTYAGVSNNDDFDSLITIKDITFAGPTNTSMNENDTGITNNYSIKLLHNVNQEKPSFSSTTYRTTAVIDRRENDVTDHVNFTNPSNTPMPENNTETTYNYSKELSQNAKQEQQPIENFTYTEDIKNEEFDSLISIKGINFVSPMNTSMDNNDTGITNNYSTKLSHNVNQEEPSLSSNTATTYNYSKELSQNVKHEQEQEPIEYFTYTEDIKNDDYDSLITINFVNPMNTSLNDTDTGITNNYSTKLLHNVNQEEPSLSSTTYRTTAVIDSRENDVTEYSKNDDIDSLITINFVNPMNSSLDDNDTEITNNYSTKLLHNVNQEEPSLSSTTYRTTAVIDSRENDVTDHVNFTNPSNTPMYGNNTETTYNYSKELSQNVKQDQQHIENSTYTEYSKNDDIDSLITINFVNPMNSSLNDNDTEITNNYSTKLLHNVNQEEPSLSSTTYRTTAVIDSRENDVTEYSKNDDIDSLITINFVNPMNSSLNDNDTEITNNYSSKLLHNVNQEEPSLSSTTYRTTAVIDSRENDVTEYSKNDDDDIDSLITINFVNPMNSSLNDNDTEITNNYSSKLLHNVNQEEPSLSSTTYRTTAVIDSRENDVTDHVNFTNPSNTPMYGNNTETTYNYSKELSQNVKQEQEPIEYFTYTKD